MCWADNFLSGKDTTQESASQVLHHMKTHIPKRASWVSRHAWVRGKIDRDRGDRLAIESLSEILDSK